MEHDTIGLGNGCDECAALGTYCLDCMAEATALAAGWPKVVATPRSICRFCGHAIRLEGSGLWAHVDTDCWGCGATLEYDPKHGTVLRTSGTSAEPVDAERDLIVCAHVYCDARFFYVAARKHPTMCTDHAALMTEGAI